MKEEQANTRNLIVTILMLKKGKMLDSVLQFRTAEYNNDSWYYKTNSGNR